MKLKILTLFAFVFSWCLTLSAQTVSVKGTVTDESKVPLPGVSVLIKNTTRGVATDFDGKYEIKANRGEVLVFSYLGFVTQEKVVGGGNNLTINVLLVEEAQQLEDVVVVGYGTQKKENLTGAVATVDAKILDSRPVSSITQALQGAVPGLNFSVGNGGGELNNSLNINIRGAGTIGDTTSSPLVLIDGMEGNLNTLNPQDVESISVLKDAASSSIYGSRAAFGVILVKTKSGKEGRISVNYNQNFRMSSALLQPRMLDSESFAYYWNEAAQNAGTNLPFSDEIIQKIIKYKNGELKDATDWNEKQRNWNAYTQSWANVDWFKQFYRNNAPAQEHNLSVSGGTEKVNFFFSANILDQEGLLRYNTDKRQRKSVVGKFTAKLHDKIKLDYKTQFIRIDDNKPIWGGPLFYHNVARRWPTLPVYDPNGFYKEGNEIAQLEGGTSFGQEDEFIQQLSFVITPIKNWNIHVEGNYKTKNIFNNSYALPIYYYDNNKKPVVFPFGGIGLNKAGQTYVSEYGYKSEFYSPNIYSNYSFSINDIHNFKLVAGFQAELNKYRSLSASRDGLYTPDVITINTTYGDNDNVGGEKQHWATAGFFGRINYDLAGRYLFEFNTRYDGTSRYLRDQRWNLFLSGSFGWNVAREDFWKSLGGFTEHISTLKPRVSYGKLGNQNIKNWYPFFQSMPLGASNGYWLINNQRTNTASAPGLVSSLLTWERVSTANFGLDINMFKNRLGVVFDYFVRKTEGMVGPAPELPSVLGTGVPRYNNTDMESKGFELELSWNDRLENGLGYSAKFTLTDSRQFVTNYPNEKKLLNQPWYSGKEDKEIWGYITKGIAKTDAEMTEHLAKNTPSWGSNWAAGDIMYEDLNGDGKVNNGDNTVDNPGDLRIIGNATPRYNFGLSLGADWKGIDVSLFFQGTAKRDLDLRDVYFRGANGNRWQNAGYVEHLDYFRPEGTKSPFGPNVDSYYPRPIENSGWKNFEPQTRWLQNGAYIRLKNVQVGYTVPADITKSIGVTKLRFYISAENIWTYTKLTKIYDPETFGGAWGEGKIYPLSKVVSTGLSLTF
ncbi:SusC/RagA family TonB-linked outer membrane protein [Capnocytophaga canis]|uniref:SusC/RagA family TonB-linked outer membrane protein n=1 Tax=Capnocytophaga canis TaxID=1848903 RepID=UPI001562D61A|nr:TonB-dependent receptor [Capnocytophaga canis]